MQEFDDSQDLETFFAGVSLKQREYYSSVRGLFGRNIEGTSFIVLYNNWQEVAVMYVPSREREIKVIFQSSGFNFKDLRENNKPLWKEFQDRFMVLIQKEVPNEISDKQKILFHA